MLSFFNFPWPCDVKICYNFTCFFFLGGEVLRRDGCRFPMVFELLRRKAKTLQAGVRSSAEDHFLVATCVISSAKLAHQTTMLQIDASSFAETWLQRFVASMIASL